MPLSMKIQPIDAGSGEFPAIEPPKPVVKSRLKRLFRISVSEPAVPSAEPFEPSSVCLAKMVQNFIEESNEKASQSPAIRCGRNRCNCFNGNGSDGSDGESDNTVSSADVCDFLKSLVVCASMNERNVLADTAKIIAEKKICKRKDELRKIVTEGLMGLGYDAAICKSKWEKSPSFPAGEYEYVDVIVGGERLIIDIDFRSEFEVARSTKTYKSILQTLPHIFVGKSDRLSKIICILSEAAKQSLKKKGMHIPPWRKADYVQAKWLSPPTRIASTSTATTAPVTATPPPSPLSPTSSVMNSDGPSPNKVVGPDHNQADESELSRSSPPSESVFDMSESSGEEEVKQRVNNPNKGSEAGVKMITGLASIMEEKP
ncbi:Casein kinase I isoform delta-B [Bienertia sinuspersici]